MVRAGITLALAATLLVMGIWQWVRPFSSAPIPPVVLIAMALLVLLRFGLMWQRQRRLAMMQNLPKRPLGIDDATEDR